MGVLGGGRHDERFDAKQIVVSPVGDGVRIREVVDQDFGTFNRHGYERVIPNDFGVPTDIVASSPDAPDARGVAEAHHGTAWRGQGGGVFLHAFEARQTVQARDGTKRGEYRPAGTDGGRRVAGEGEESEDTRREDCFSRRSCGETLRQCGE